MISNGNVPQQFQMGGLLHLELLDLNNDSLHCHRAIKKKTHYFARRYTGSLRETKEDNPVEECLWRNNTICLLCKIH